MNGLMNWLIGWFIPVLVDRMKWKMTVFIIVSCVDYLLVKMPQIKPIGKMIKDFFNSLK